MKFPKGLAWIVAIVGVCPLTADTLDLSFGQHWASNVLQTRYAEPDFVSALDFNMIKDFSGLSLLAGAGMDYFARNPDMSFFSARAGMEGVVPIGRRSGLSLSGIMEGALYRDGYDDFNHVSLGLAGAFKTYITQSSIAKANADFEYRKYVSGIFDFVSQALAVSLDKFLVSNTTLKAGAGWGFKYFLHPFASEGVPGSTSGDPQGQGARRGPGSYVIAGNAGSGQAIQNLTVSGLLAQGLGSSFGLSLSYDRQWTISGKSPFASVEETYLAENPTYDRFAWEGWGLAGVLTAHLFRDIEIKLGYTITDRRFPGIESRSLEGVSLGITREDRRRQADIKIEKDFRRFTLFLAGAFVHNRSNAPLFDWTGVFISGGIQWNAAFGKKR